MAHPVTMPIIGVQKRSAAEPRSVRATTTTRVASAVKCAATGSASVALSSRPKMTEARVMESIIITAPPTIGVTIRLRMNSHLEMTTWKAADTSIRVVRVAGPPSTRAMMQNGMANGAVTMGRRAPAPTGPSRRTCMSVAAPIIKSEAKTIQIR